MRRIVLQPGSQFKSRYLNRTGAFNADALIAATSIVEDVRERGDAALREYTEKFDGVRIEDFRISKQAIDEAIVDVDPKTAEALRQAAAQIRDFHERHAPAKTGSTVREDGALVGSKVEPLESVGIYVPGGRALYPSSVLMNALPAAVAGVKRIVCVTPPRPTERSIPPSSRRAASRASPRSTPWARAGHRRARVRHRVHRARRQITGPGNAYVAAAADGIVIIPVKLDATVMRGTAFTVNAIRSISDALRIPVPEWRILRTCVPGRMTQGRANRRRGARRQLPRHAVRHRHPPVGEGRRGQLAVGARG